MNIPANTIVEKIKSETGKLSAVTDSGSKYDAMQRIHLLSELWLESYKDEIPQPKQESRQAAQTDLQPSKLLKNDTKDIRISDEDTSIFDF